MMTDGDLLYSSTTKRKPTMLRHAVLVATCLAALVPGMARAEVGKKLDGCFLNGHQVPCDGGDEDRGNEDGGYHCNPGFHLAPSGNCLPNGYPVDCGSYSCKLGDFCGPHNSCVPVGTSRDRICSDGTYCSAGNKCTSDNKCVTNDPLSDCGNNEYCPSGQACLYGSPIPVKRGCIAELPPDGSETYEHQRDRLIRDWSDIISAHNNFVVPKADAHGKKVWNRRTNIWEVPTSKTLLEVAWQNKTTLYNSLLDALYILGAPWFMPDPLGADFHQRLILDHRIDEELKGLMKREVAAAILLMTDQAGALTPFEWDSPELKERKKDVADKETKALMEIYHSTTAHIDRDAFSRSSDGRSVIYTPGSAIQQLNDIKDNPFWENCSEINACSSK
jgi:hypothetical protein